MPQNGAALCGVGNLLASRRKEMPHQVKKNRRGEAQRINPVEDAAMTRKQAAAVLHLGLALEQRLEEIALDRQRDVMVPYYRSLAAVLAFGLTPRESEVLIWVAQGKTNSDVAAILGIRPHTVRTHLERVRAKYAAVGRAATTNGRLQQKSLL